MRFRLTYAGKLLGASRSNTRASLKHQIRKHFHPHLKRFWQNSRMLNLRMSSRTGEGAGGLSSSLFSGSTAIPYRDYLTAKHVLGPFSFVPLVTDELSLSCSLNVLFLRPNQPGDLIRGGDIDNRLKTLFDSLRKPQNLSELAGQTPNENEMPFFCLLEDDRLISKISVETDSLLEPIADDKIRSGDTRLIIDVHIQPIHATFSNLDFVGN